MSKKLYAAIEGGGTKFLCAVMDEEAKILTQSRFPSLNPEETLANCLSFFEKAQETHGKLSALGIASFGPLDPRKTSPDYGKILATPKPGWAGTDLIQPFKAAFGIPVGLDTDVNGAVLAESLWGAGKGLNSLIYFTIGTGIGGGVMAEKRLIHGLMHPELGHIRIPHEFQTDPFTGICPFHGDCFEGLASGPAIEARWGIKAAELPPDHPAWALEARYLALALSNVVLTLLPERIVLGGGVMEQSHLFPLIRAQLLQLLGGYLQIDHIVKEIDTYIVPSGLQGISGLFGALALAMRAADEASK